jgi:hypothetical protein
MRRFTLVAACVLALTALVALAQVNRQAAGPAAAHGVTQWEYANFYFSATTGKWHWLTSGSPAGTGEKEIFAALGGKAQKEVFSIDVMAQAGRQGWELVSAVPDQNHPNYWFKRAAPQAAR